MPEGDSVFRAARALHEALAGRVVSRFESVFPRLTARLDGGPLAGRTIERVDARGKHLLIWFSGALVLRTHLRMHGSWHLYRPGERWRRPHHQMRLVIETPEVHAIAFNVPIAEFEHAATLDLAAPLRDLGPDPLKEDFDLQQAMARLRAAGPRDIGDALLDQRTIAGIGNIYKSETLFVSSVNPFAPVETLTPAQLARIVRSAARLLRANVTAGAGETAASLGPRRTTGRMDRHARFWVYGRAGQPCRRCGTPIARARQGPHARSTYWCPACQVRHP